MAQSPTHRFGQIIGQVLEEALGEPLREIARRHGLYLDHKHPRPARDGRSKVRWTDYRGNRHDLDYVLEDGGSEETVGRPRAFIEIAYRRYTKHSRNKAQEIQGAITPLFQTFREDHPFIGVVLAGVFTEPSVAQLRSHGFGVLYLPFENIVRAFARVGVDAHFDEDSSDREVQRKVNAWKRLGPRKRSKLPVVLRDLHRAEFAKFLRELEACLTRAISRVIVVTLSGSSRELKDAEAAVAYIEGYDESSGDGPFVRYEVIVRYTNGDELQGSFRSKVHAVQFLRRAS